jgi:hypothetical protein
MFGIVLLKKEVNQHSAAERYRIFGWLVGWGGGGVLLFCKGQDSYHYQSLILIQE